MARVLKRGQNDDSQFIRSKASRSSQGENHEESSSSPSSEEQLLVSPNPHLKDLPVDVLYHLGLDSTMNLQAMFSDVKFVCLGGSGARMRHFAKTAANFLLSKSVPAGCELTPIGKPERYELYKVGPILSVSHGMGMPSIKILLHELAKLLALAKARDYCFIRVGTCGGLGVEPGTVVLSTEALTTKFQPYHKTAILGKTQKIPTTLSESLNKAIFDCRGDIPVIMGRTISTNDFYEEQGRLDGYFCEFSEQEKQDYLNLCAQHEVVNFEMESGAFAAFCYRAKIPAAVVCSVLVNRIKGDQVNASSSELSSYVENAITLVLSFIQRRMECNQQDRPIL